MKKLLTVLLSLALVLSLVACSNEDQGQAEPNQEESSQVESPDQEDQGGEEDSDNEEVEESVEDVSVVAGTVAISQILDALEYDNVVGIPTTVYEVSDRYSQVTQIGKPMEPDMELVKSTNADLFISVESLREANEGRLDQINMESLFVDLDTVDNIIDSIVQIGQAIGVEDRAQDLVADMNDRVQEISSKAQDQEDVQVLFLFGSPRSIMVGTDQSYVGNLLEILDVHNVASDIIPDSQSAYVPINMENIVTTNPDYIIRMTHASPDEAQKMLDEEFKSDVWQSMEAVQEGRVIDLEIDLFSVSGGVNVIEALDRLYQHIYE